MSVGIAIRATRPGINLVTPTFPPLPEGVWGLVVVPYEVALINRITGGEMVVGTPLDDSMSGLFYWPEILATPEWDGGPSNFWDEQQACSGEGLSRPGVNDHDCYRFEVFRSPLQGGTTSEFQEISFAVDATVSRFRVRLLVLADMADKDP